MDNKALQIVMNYAAKQAVDSYGEVPKFDVYIVWKSKVLQNWKYLLSTTLADGMYYELTYNGDKREWYFDAYRKVENICIPD